MFSQKTASGWFLKNPRYFIYFLREFTGVIISLYFLAQLFGTASWWTLNFTAALTPLVFAAAILHSITWFWVTTKIMPLPDKLPLRIAAFIGLLGAWAAASYLIFYFFYETTPVF